MAAIIVIVVMSSARGSVVVVVVVVPGPGEEDPDVDGEDDEAVDVSLADVSVDGRVRDDDTLEAELAVAPLSSMTRVAVVVKLVVVDMTTHHTDAAPYHPLQLAKNAAWFFTARR